MSTLPTAPSSSTGWVNTISRTLPEFSFSDESSNLLDLRIQGIRHSFSDESEHEADEEVRTRLTHVEDYFMDFIISLVKNHAKNNKPDVFTDELIDAIIDDSKKLELKTWIKIQRARCSMTQPNENTIEMETWGRSIHQYNWDYTVQERGKIEIAYCVNQFINLLNQRVFQ